jgi:hypothetical protein
LLRRRTKGFLAHFGRGQIDSKLLKLAVEAGYAIA